MLTEETQKLTAEQKEILKDSFLEMQKDTNRSGIFIFIGLFQDYPQYKNLWPQFRTIPDSSLMDSELLKMHADVFMAGLHDIILHIDNEEALSEQLMKIARAHQRKGVRRTHVEHMITPALDSLKHACDNPGGLSAEAKGAWIALFDVIANLIEQFRPKVSVTH